MSFGKSENGMLTSDSIPTHKSSMISLLVIIQVVILMVSLLLLV